MKRRPSIAVLAVFLTGACATESPEGSSGGDDTQVDGASTGGSSGPSETSDASPPATTTSEPDDGTSTTGASTTTGGPVDPTTGGADVSTSTDATGSTGEVPTVEVSIDFDELRGGEIVAEQFAPFVLFSAAPGYDVEVLSNGSYFNTSEPNYVYVPDRADMIVEFPQPVRDLRLNAVGVRNEARFVTLQIHLASGEVHSLDLIGDGENQVVDEIDLSEYVDIVELHMTDIDDPSGAGWDDIRFLAPEPD